MRTILKGFVGAALLFSASAVSAQDYTWTLSDFYFDKYGPLAAGIGSYTSPDGGRASGTLVLTKDGSNYVLSSYNFTTTSGASGLSAVYNSTLNEDFSTGEASAFSSFIQMVGVDEESVFRIVWTPGSLFEEMETNGLGNEVELPGAVSREYQVGGERRYNGTGNEICPALSTAGCVDANAGILTLTSIVQPTVATPEPGTMAVLGAGLLGLFAARRRRAA